MLELKPTLSTQRPLVFALCAALASLAALALALALALPTRAFADSNADGHAETPANGQPDTGAPSVDTAPIKNWEAYAVIDKNFQSLDCENIGEFPPEEIDDHIGQVWLPVTAGQTQELTPRLYAKTHHGVPEDTAARLFADADADGDGKVILRESRDQFVRLIEQLDLNGDRWLTRAELDQSEPGQPFAQLVGAGQDAAPETATASADVHGQKPQHDHSAHDHSAHE